MMSYYIGLMSGTSMDGVDAAIIDVKSMKLLDALTFTYPDSLKGFLTEVLATENPSYSSLVKLNQQLGSCFADAVELLLERSSIKKQDIQAIGSHGQTLWHQPDLPYPYSLQLACPHTIAERTGLTVITDFRTRDLIVGGQGAPFAPLFHEILWGQHDELTAIVNIGGIANISFIGKNSITKGWDVGPGNCLMDQWIKKHKDFDFDENGQWAATGEAQEELVQAIMDDPLLTAPAPKSFDRNYFSLKWLESYINANYRPEDIEASLSELTARCIKNAIAFADVPPAKLYLCGGGAHNNELQRRIKKNLPELEIMNTDTLGVDADYVEAMLFAWLASKTLNREAVDLRAISGSTKPVLLGAVYYP